MKILFLTHNLLQDNGAGVFSLRLIYGIRENMHCEIAVLTTVPSGQSFEKPILYPQKFKLLRQWRTIHNIMRDCDVIHALDAFPYGIIAVLFSRGLGKKVIITAAGSGSIIPLYQKKYAWLLRFAYHHADVLTAISTFTRSEILKKVPELSIVVINHGVDIEKFEHADGSYYPMEQYQPYILGVGQLRWRKGYHFSIKSFAKIAKEFPDFHYVIVGKKYKDDYYERLQNLVAELGLQKRVHILENVNTEKERADVYKQAELFCLFSQNVNHDVEGFGLVFLEAAAAGLPVVGAKNCGIDDAVAEGKNGFLVPTRSADDFADAILKILRNQALKKKMAIESLAYARAYTWDKKIREYIDIYRTIL